MDSDRHNFSGVSKNIEMKNVALEDFSGIWLKIFWNLSRFSKNGFDKSKGGFKQG